MGYIVIKNFIDEDVQVLDEKYYNGTELDICIEAKEKYPNLVDGEIRACYFKTFTKHQERPGLIIRRNNVGPAVMPLGHIDTKNNKWKQYKENKIVQDWNVEGLHQPTYANTGALLSLDDVIIKGRLGQLTRNDYDRIVEPVVQKHLKDELDKLFESIDSDNIIEVLKNE